MTERPTPRLYLAAPRDADAVPWCGISHPWPEHCPVCEQYEATWAPPDEFITAAWRRTQQ